MSNGYAKAMKKDIYSFLCCFQIARGAGRARQAVDAVSTFYTLEKNGSLKADGRWRQTMENVPLLRKQRLQGMDGTVYLEPPA